MHFLVGLFKCILFLILILYFSSCSYLVKKENYIEIRKNIWSGKEIIFSDVSDGIINSKEINKGWTKLNKQKYIPYFKLKNSRGLIVGDYFYNGKEFLVIELKNKKKYKWEKKYWEKNDNLLPAHLCDLNDLNKAKSLVGKNIWLNYFMSDTIFINNGGQIFHKFQKVIVKDTKIYHNGGKYQPIWLGIGITNNNEISWVRYNGPLKSVGRKNYYFTTDPLQIEWTSDEKMKIISGELFYGMSKRQVRYSIGNPDKIINTSSKHNISQQWIYGKELNNKRYLQFEYDKLVSM